MRRLTLVVALAVSGGVATSLRAIDHSNLDAHRPLRFEDAYPVAHGERVLETGVGASFERERDDRAFLDAEALYGLFPNAHVGLGTAFSTDPHEVEGQEKSGDLRLSALYNLNQETLDLPAFALKGQANFPTGVDSRGTDLEFTGIATRSFGRLGLHLNAGYAFIGGERGNERDGQYKVALGTSYPLGAPRHTRTALLADLFTGQSMLRGDKNVLGAEAGVRYQLGTQSTVDLGLGSEFSGPDQRASLYATAGISHSF